MPKTVADPSAGALGAAGVMGIYGIAGDGLNGLTGTIRRQRKIERDRVWGDELVDLAKTNL